MERSGLITRVEREAVEDFLYSEADLLDRWELDAWVALFEEDARYEVPTTDIDSSADPATSLYLIADDMRTLRGRVERLNHRNAYAESPHARTRRFITNVRIDSIEGDILFVRANFQVFRFKNAIVDTFIGRYEHGLRMSDRGFTFVRRRAVLDLEALRPLGKLSIIL
ncbi:MAG TPA: aromatic-ring-hydroxylating dioxygenase subunit beta [Candidatus Aquilonibacter sp.]